MYELTFDSISTVCASISSTAGNEGQVITSTHDTYPISAESAEDADSWVAAINGVMREVELTVCLSVCLSKKSVDWTDCLKPS